MATAEKLLKALKSEYGITTYEELVKATEDMDLVDVSLFVSKPVKEVRKNESKDLEKSGNSQAHGRNGARVRNRQRLGEERLATVY